MRVLFCVRHNFFSSPGGAQIQILKTKEYLERLGVICELTSKLEDANLDDYDIIHLSDLTWVYAASAFLKKLPEFKGKIVLSTIYWPFDDYAANGAPLLQKIIYKLFGIDGFEFAKSIGKALLKKEKSYLNGLFESYISKQKNILTSVDWLLPNSNLEMVAIKNRLGHRTSCFTVVPNAIDCSIFDSQIEKYGFEKEEDLITFVARIDPRKNQLTFLRAMRGTTFKILFVGSPGPNCSRYFMELKKEAQSRGNVEFISHIPQEEVFKHMLRAKVNVLTSWIETPGLVSLEAGYARCNIVVSDKGTVRDYFSDFACYCEPGDVVDIKNKVIEAMAKPFDERFREHIREKYTWEMAAKKTLEAYVSVLSI